MSTARFLRLRTGAGTMLPLRVRRCDTFLCRLRGLMFGRKLASDEALLFVESRESRVTTAIHMCFVFFPIGVLWLVAGEATGHDLPRSLTVVDRVLAQPFRPYYAPQTPAQYYLEGSSVLLEWVEVGEHLFLDPEP